MSYTSLNPKFDSTTLKDQGANSVSNPAASSHKIVDRNGILYLKNSSGVEIPIGTAGSGTKNYLSALVTSLGSGAANPGNGDFETGGVTGWSLAHSTLTSLVPTSVASAGTTFSASAGGTAANGNLSFASISSGQLGGRYCASLASSSASTAGDLLVSDAFFIDLEDQAKMLNFSFAFKAVTGTFDMSGTSTNTFAVYIYDITNGAWIQPAGVYNLTQSAGVGKCTGSFQTTSNSTKYQIALVNINATSGAYALYVDDFQMGPNVASTGYPGSDWTAYTPTLTGFGTAAGVDFKWRRNGDSIDIRGYFTSGTSTAVIGTLTLPPGLVLANTSSFGNRGGNYGRYDRLDTGGPTAVATANYSGSLDWDNSLATNVLAFFARGQSGTYAATNANSLFSSGDGVAVQGISIPIAGWSSNSVMSTDTDTRVCSASYYATASNQTVGTAQAINYDAKTKDTHGAVTTGSGWKFTAPLTGTYQVEIWNRSGSSGGATNWVVYKNGTAHKFLGFANTASTANSSGATTVELNAGDYIDVRASGTVDVGGGTLGVTASQVDIYRLTGPAVVAASEKVVAQYGLTSAVNPGATSVLKYDTKLKDSHSAYSTSTGLFTAPVTGTYKVAAASEAGAAVTVYVVKNGSGVAYVSTTSGSGAAASGSADVDCVAGDTLAIYSVQSATYGAITGGIYQNYLSISKV